MKVELLVVPDCPNEAAAAALLRKALTDVGLHDVAVRTTEVNRQQDAERRGFVRPRVKAWTPTLTSTSTRSALSRG
jgi:hypothetical protein